MSTALRMMFDSSNLSLSMEPSRPLMTVLYFECSFIARILCQKKKSGKLSEVMLTFEADCWFDLSDSAISCEER